MRTDFVIGIIRGPHGLSGKVKVESTSGEFEHFLNLTDVTLRKGEKAVKAAVESAEIGTSCLFIKFKGIDCPEEAKEFSSWRIVVPRNMACPLGSGEFYAEDLKGCALLYNGDGIGKAEKEPVRVGIVTDVVEGGSGNLLEVALSESADAAIARTDKVKPSAKGGKTVLIPFNKEFIGTVDIKNAAVQLMHLWILE